MPTQSSFGFSHGRESCWSVAAIAHGDENRDLALRLPSNVYLGTSSWSFPGWRGLVYDRSYSSSELAQQGLPAYAEHPLFRGVGLDRTYYGPITVDRARYYRSQVPSIFSFTVKAPRELTTLGTPHTLDVAWAKEMFIEPLVEGLGETLGAIVFQFPPHEPSAFGGAESFADCLHTFLTGLPAGPRYAVEVRNGPWLIPAYTEALCDTDTLHCMSVHPRLPNLHVQLQAAGATLGGGLVLRWNLGHQQQYGEARSRYSPFDRLVDPDEVSRDHISRLCARAAMAGKVALVTINNKAEGSAPMSVGHLAQAIVDRLDGSNSAS